MVRGFVSGGGRVEDGGEGFRIRWYEKISVFLFGIFMESVKI